jgi:hypothetical protein
MKSELALVVLSLLLLVACFVLAVATGAHVFLP